MQAFHFGESSQPLYGVVHHPGGSDYRNQAVLICCPIGHEYFITHRLLKLLAQKIADAGYYVMRFDYFGTGESLGENTEGNLVRWQRDISYAVDELKSISNQDHIVGVGVRLGANLLALASAKIGLCRLLLWEPVFQGNEYVDMLKNLTDTSLKSRWYFLKERDAEEVDPGEMLGFHYGDQVLAELRNLSFPDIDCETLVYAPCKPEHLQASTDQVKFRHCETICKWSDVHAIDTSVSSVEFSSAIHEALV